MVMIGEGRVTYQVETLDGAEALKRAGLKPVVLSSKEGLILLSGTTSVTAFALMAATPTAPMPVWRPTTFASRSRICAK